MIRIRNNLKGCIKFVNTNPGSPDFKLKITPLTKDGAEEKQCYSYPGIHKKLLQSGSEQSLVLARGREGCLASDTHNILKYFAIGLGQSTEHQRPDRNKYIEVYPENIAKGQNTLLGQTFSLCQQSTYFPSNP